MTSLLAIIGATGSNGRLATSYALDRGLKVRAVNRSVARARRIFSSQADNPKLTLHEADATDPAQLAAAVGGADAVVLAHGDDAQPENNYRIIANAVAATPAEVPISLMSAISVTQEIPSFADILDWRRRGERLLRASRDAFTIIRPGWFDGHAAGDDRIVLEQGDRTPLRAMRGVSRRHIAEALVNATLIDEAQRRTVEIFSEPGDEVTDFHTLFGACEPDPAGSLDGVFDPAGLPLDAEPSRVRTDLAAADQRFL